MKKRTIESIILSALGIILGYVLHSHIQNPYAILYNLVSYVWMCGVFYFVGRIWIGEPEKKHKKSFYRWVFTALIFGGWVFVNFFLVIYYQNLTGNPLNLLHIFHPYYMDNYLQGIAPALVLGPVYGYFRRLNVAGKRLQLKKTLGWTIGSITGIVVIIGGVYWYDVSYEGDQAIKFLDKDQQLTSLEEVMSHPELIGKKVFVDVWFSTCGPCISAFKNKDAGKELLSSNDYVFLYLGREIAQPNSKQHWINTIQEYELQGYHVYMSEDLNNEVINEVSKRIDRYFGYPHYMIIDEKGEVSEWDAPDVTDIEGLKKVIAS